MPRMTPALTVPYHDHAPTVRSLRITTLMVAVFAGVPGAGLQGQHTPADADRHIAAVVGSVARAQIANGHLVGMTVAVDSRSGVRVVRGYGMAHVGLNAPANDTTLYKIASVSKQVTAAAILQLVEAGKLALDDPITNHLPGYPTHGHAITVRHLLTHTSGVQGFRVLHEDNRQRFRVDLTYVDMVAMFGTAPLEFAPGEKHVYNNMGYYLLGEIIARVSGVPYGTYVERELFRPLGPTSMYFCDERRVLPNRAEGYERDSGQLVRARYISEHVTGAAGALCATAGDLVRWTNALHGGNVVSAQSLREMLAPAVLTSGKTVPYGFGVSLEDRFGHSAVSHGGMSNGFASVAAHFPESGVTIVVLANAESARSYEVVRAVMQCARCR